MIKRYIFTMLTMALVLLLVGSCSSEHEFDIAGDATEALKSGMVRFSLDKSLTQHSAASGVQTPEEQQVNSIYAVVFNDISKDAMTGMLNTEVDGDTFLKCIKVSDVAGQTSGQLYEFEIGKGVGCFQVCFVANPDNKLVTAIEGLTSKTVADFKALVADQAIDVKTGLLMTSSFYGVKLNPVSGELLTSVDLTRAVARVDILNGAEGVAVTKIEFINRAIKTPLVNSTNTTDKANLALAAEVVDIAGGKLIGSSIKPTVATAYSYEQLSSIDGPMPLYIYQDWPGLRITYQYIGDHNATPHVKEMIFVNDQYVPIVLERNHRYTVKLIGSGGDFGFIVSAADWVAGDDIKVDSETVLGGLSPEPAVN